MILGSHISTKDGLLNVLKRAESLGVKAIQIHPSQPQQWAKPKITDEQAAKFSQEMKQRKLGPLFFHSIYLINFASNNPAIWHGSINSTVNYLKLAPKMKAAGVITHLGSTKGADWTTAKKRVIDGLNRVFDDLHLGTASYPPTTPKFIIETAAGAGNIIGDDLDEIAEIFQAIKDKYPCGICIDTAHMFASGAPIHTKEGLEKIIQDIDRSVGLNNLIAVHLNDSQAAFGSKQDRHANIGYGQIGDEALARIINHPKLRQLPFILEVPGFHSAGPDQDNVQKVLSLLK